MMDQPIAEFDKLKIGDPTASAQELTPISNRVKSKMFLDKVDLDAVTLWDQSMKTGETSLHKVALQTITHKACIYEF